MVRLWGAAAAGWRRHSGSRHRALRAPRGGGAGREGWFSIIEREAIHRGTFGTVRDLDSRIRALIDGWSDRAHHFTWTRTADQALKKANRKKTSDAEQ